MVVCGKKDFVKQQCDESLKRLGIDCIDLYYAHRIDPDTHVDETMEALKELHQEGKIKYAGLSECTPDDLERAHKVFLISAIQMEWSLVSRDLEDLVITAARNLRVGIVAYSPLGRGLLSGTFTKKEDLSPNDRRNIILDLRMKILRRIYR
jgi:aryl-alcohol dehydrogenase-like predicted oxidoreductase